MLKYIIGIVNLLPIQAIRWEASRIIGNTAQKFPDKVKRAIPKLLKNTNDEDTVVRGSAAFALTEIAKSSKDAQKELVPEFNKVLKREDNKGVRNIYLKYLKQLDRGGKI